MKSINISKHNIYSIDRREWNNVKLLENQIHLWILKLGFSQSEISYLETILSEEEREKMNRFKFQRDRELYLIAHSFLRILLGNYMNLGYEDIEFIILKNGKPALKSETYNEHIFFNISHSGSIVALTFSKNLEVGVDIELVALIEGIEDIVNNCFHPSEKRYFNEIDRSIKIDEFISCWTKKEAVLKALGLGLGFGMDKFSVEKKSLGFEDWCNLNFDSHFCKCCYCSFEPERGYKGAIAYKY